MNELLTLIPVATTKRPMYPKVDLFVLLNLYGFVLENACLFLNFSVLKIIGPWTIIIFAFLNALNDTIIQYNSNNITKVVVVTAEIVVVEKGEEMVDELVDEEEDVPM